MGADECRAGRGHIYKHFAPVNNRMRSEHITQFFPQVHHPMGPVP